MPQYSDEQIREYVEANIDNPAAIAEVAAAAGVSMEDLSRATGFSVDDIGGYFDNAGVEPPPTPEPAYFDANPDVANAYQDNSYGMTPQEFADFHYTNYGADEGRAASSESAAAEVAPPAQTYTQTDETGTPIYEYVAPAAVVTPPPEVPVYTPPPPPPCQTHQF